MKKRLLALLLTLLLCLGMLPAKADGCDLSYERILAMVDHMTEMATGDYLTIQGVPEELQSVARAWAGQITGEPTLVVRANLQGSAAMVNLRASYMREPDVVLMELESTGVIEMLNDLAYQAAEDGNVAAQSYERIMEINALLNASMLWAEPGAEAGYEMYFVLHEGGTPIILLAIAENDAVTVSGWFMPSDRLARCSNVGFVSMWLMLSGYTAVCEAVQAE